MREDDRALKPLSRRDFLVVGGGACLAAAWSLPGCEDGSGSGANLADGVFQVGNSDDFDIGDATLFDEGPFFVLRDDEGLWAMTAVCPHQGCTVNAGTDSLPCPCHGSVFDLDGTVLNGPASKPLDNLKVVIESDGTVSVDTGATVPAGTRVQG